MNCWSKILLGFFCCTGCVKREEKIITKSTEGSFAFLESLKNQLPSHFSMECLKGYIQAKDLPAASKYVNLAIKRSISNPALHVINGFVYEEMARSGNMMHADMAGIAYRSARDLDPTHWFYSYLLGMYELKEKKYEEAQKNLADALLLRPKDSNILYALACASYYVKDIPVALHSIEKTIALNPKEPSIFRSAAIIFASAGKFAQAKEALACYQNMAGPSLAADVARVQQRIQDWRITHERARCTYSVENVNIFGDEEELPEDSENLNQNPTIILDGYLMNIVENNTTNKGNNILMPMDNNGAFNSVTNTLGVILGGGAGELISGTRDILRNTATGRDPSSGSTKSNSWTKTFSYGVTLSQVTYSLNIANANELIMNVMARPSVSTILGKPASFSNSDCVVGTVAGSQVTVDAGIKIECTPEKIDPDGCILLKITLTNSTLSGPPQQLSGITNQLIAVNKAKAATSVKVYPGQTVMIAGINTESRVAEDSGVPFLRSLPLVQYFFANLQTISSLYNILFLVTPRLGGSSSSWCKKGDPFRGPSNVAKHLKKHGVILGNMGEYSTMYYLHKYFEKSPLFADFQSGDITQPFWGYQNVDLPYRLNQLKAFLYF